MRMSCNGCRVLRKGCSHNCSIRPCLQWIKSSDSQANATVFLAKFYGRAGLLNLLNSGPDHLRPAIFRSLLYEACGRIVNPIHGSVGLMWAGNWNLCQAAVEAVLSGDPITPVSEDAAAVAPGIKGYDIRHVVKEDHHEVSGTSSGLHRVVKARPGFKRAGPGKPKGGKMAALAEAVAEMDKAAAAAAEEEGAPVGAEAESARHELGESSPSRESSVSHGETTMESMVSVEMAEAAATVREATPEAAVFVATEKEVEVELDLRLSL